MNKSTSTHVFDRLEAVRRAKNTVLCVGIDPRLERTPEELRRVHGNDIEELLYHFGAAVIEAAGANAAAFKPQIAFFEAHGVAGLRAFSRVVKEGRRLGHVVIADAKRGDIKSTAAAYARGFFEPGADFEVDLLTVNPYLGADSLSPYLELGSAHGKGIFVLVRTSNPGGADLQEKRAADGRPFFEHTADLARELGATSVGESGLSLVGAVVGATTPEAARALREQMPQTPFLVPGYGVQGGTASDTTPNFRADGSGAIVSASRSVTYPTPSGSGWQADVEAAARAARLDLDRALRETRT